MWERGTRCSAVDLAAWRNRSRLLFWANVATSGTSHSPMSRTQWRAAAWRALASQRCPSSKRCSGKEDQKKRFIIALAIKWLFCFVVFFPVCIIYTIGLKINLHRPTHHRVHLCSNSIHTNAPVNVIPQYPLCGDTGGFDIYSNQISHHRGNLFGSNPC